MPVNKLPLGICWGTLIKASLPELIAEAGRNGFGTIAVTPPSFRRCLEAGTTVAELRTMLADHGVRVTVIDPLLAGLPGSPRPEDVPENLRDGFLHDEAYCYVVAEALGAKVVNVAHFLGKAVPLPELAGAIKAMGRRAAAHGLQISLEFIPGTGMPDLVTANEIVELAGEPNLGVLFDTWHFVRSGSTLEQLRALPPGRINALQISDRIPPPPGAAYVPMSGRLFPGEGEQPLDEILKLVFANNASITAEIEVFSADLSAMPVAAAAEHAAQAIRTWLAGKGASIEWP
jgi:sugar phosphate isomerase/epimerase